MFRVVQECSGWCRSVEIQGCRSVQIIFYSLIKLIHYLYIFYSLIKLIHYMYIFWRKSRSNLVKFYWNF